MRKYLSGSLVAVAALAGVSACQKPQEAAPAPGAAPAARGRGAGR